jgi:ATP-dependent helicase/nuclease subunit A
MSAIEIISASAGSGKTYRLTEILEQVVRDKSVRPEAVIATTFTRKAAAELREKVRQRLLQAGLTGEAQRLNAAVMGTVNSVCGKLVSDFAFDLGLSPEIRVLDEDMAEQALKRALFGVIGEEAGADVARLKETFYEWTVEAIVSEVVALARANGLDEADLAASRNRCLEEMKALLGPPLSGDGAGLEKKLVEAVKAFRRHAVSGGDSTKMTAACVESAGKFLDALKSGKPLRWQDWAYMANLSPAKKSAEAAAPVVAAAREHIRLPRFQEDIETAIRTVFDLAAAALKSYRQYKEERGLIDFVDQECLALSLLKKPEVKERLKGAYDLVLVDEFQDTSPIELEIFLRLAEAAKRSVWVGDQKQSIFGFRGSDPELMNAVIKEILGGAEPETLPQSWRSRKPLVDLTSELFARVFPRHDIPAGRVRLRAARKKDVPELGPAVERWRLRPDGRSKAAKADALAAGIKQVLEDDRVKVGEKGTDRVRRVEPRDIAVLCRRNSTCAAVAGSLAGIGIKSALARAGLMRTPEAKVVQAGLLLWSDPGDSLSAAEIARILEHPDDPDRWLDGLLRNPGFAAFKDVPAVRRIRETGVEERSRLGVLATFDRITEILSIRDLCRRWGGASERLANLNALRATAVHYLDLAAEEGAGVTTAGLATYLAGLDDGTSDARAFSPEADAVFITTWHRAKGLEWPLVILFDLDFDFQRTVPGPHIDSLRPDIDLAEPLAGRWIRYWPSPYHPKTTTVFHEPMEDHPVLKARTEVEGRESLRLLYVGWTRARDRIVLPVPADKWSAGMLEEFAEPGAAGLTPLLNEPANGKALWGGVALDVETREPVAAEPHPLAPSAEATFVADGPKDLPAAFTGPDTGDAQWSAAEPEVIGGPLARGGSFDPKDAGSAVHGFIAADRPDYDKAERLALAAEIMRLWKVSGILRSEDLVEIADRLRRWAENRWPGAKWHREWPVFRKLGSGSVMRGVADLFLETDQGLVVLDHKSYPGRIEEARAMAVEDAPQVQAYADAAAEATGRPILGLFIHLPLVGVVVELKKSAI